MSTSTTYPLPPTAIALPALALPAVLIDIPPLVWHITQHNIAASSLIIWVIIMNTFLFMNALIWPRDNLNEWWAGEGFCDIQARITVGAVVALPCAVVCIMRKLAMIMDTRHITISSRRSQMVRENVIEIVWCWGFPALMILVYHIVQPIRYFIFGISGCHPAYDASWPSVVVSWMWQPIILTLAAYYAVILLYRLYRYRREFTRLITSRNTTKSRFIRLLIMALLLVFVNLPYSWWILYHEVKNIRGAFSWSRVHGPGSNDIYKVPVRGQPFYDTWGRVVVGYVIFFVFGTGRDAKGLYRRMMLACGADKVWPSLHDTSTSAGTQQSSSSRWFWLGTKTKEFFTSTWASATTSHTTSTQDHSRSDFFHIDEARCSDPATQRSSNVIPSLLSRVFSKPHKDQTTVLPMYCSPSHKKSIDYSDSSPRSTYTAGPSTVGSSSLTQTWAEVEAGRAGGSGTQHGNTNGVTVKKEIRQESENGDDKV